MDASGNAYNRPGNHENVTGREMFCQQAGNEHENKKRQVHDDLQRAEDLAQHVVGTDLVDHRVRSDHDRRDRCAEECRQARCQGEHGIGSDADNEHHDHYTTDDQ